MSYNSLGATLDHIHNVYIKIMQVVILLLHRAAEHDNTKLLPPEKACFDKYTPKLKDTTYGSVEYKKILKEMTPALKHHNKYNRHHPEHFADGIDGMNLIDLIEMLCDWKAASERHADGDIQRSIKINADRFGIDNQLKEILINTAADLEWHN